MKIEHTINEMNESTINRMIFGCINDEMYAEFILFIYNVSNEWKN